MEREASWKLILMVNKKFGYTPGYKHILRAGIDRAIVDKALFPTVDKHASLSTK